MEICQRGEGGGCREVVESDSGSNGLWYADIKTDDGQVGE